MKTSRVVLLAAALLLVAWGPKGHTIVNHLGAQGMVGRVPAFLSTASAIFEVGYLGPEEDRIKGAGKSWDADFDPGHYFDVDDDGMVAGVVSASAMPPDLEAYNAALERAGSDQFRSGYLPYSILDGWEQVRQDFAYWRADNYAASHASSAHLREMAARDRAVMERVVVQDVGIWGHFIGDGCQPLHVTVHFNGWGNYPNPKGFSQSRETHSMFESTFVNRHVSEATVAALVPSASSLPAPSAAVSQSEAMSRIMQYLMADAHTVPQLYEIDKAGGFANASSQAVDFTARRLAAGAAELRDLTVWAWQASLYQSVGYPEIPVTDILNGSAAWPRAYSS